VRPEHNEIAAAPKPCPRKIAFAERSGKPIQIISWGRPMTLRKNQANALSGTRRGMGSGITGQIRRNNVGKIPVAAGAGSNLHRLLKRGQLPKERRATWDWRMSP
jgi:hypothetical protein